MRDRLACARELIDVAHGSSRAVAVSHAAALALPHRDQHLGLPRWVASVAVQWHCLRACQGAARLGGARLAD